MAVSTPVRSTVAGGALTPGVVLVPVPAAPDPVELPTTTPRAAHHAGEPTTLGSFVGTDGVVIGVDTTGVVTTGVDTNGVVTAGVGRNGVDTTGVATVGGGTNRFDTTGVVTAGVDTTGVVVVDGVVASGSVSKLCRPACCN
jgi:hypothetical protein